MFNYHFNSNHLFQNQNQTADSRCGDTELLSNVIKAEVGIFSVSLCEAIHYFLCRKITKLSMENWNGKLS